MSPYLARPLRSEAQARAERRQREFDETFGPVVGLLTALGLAVAVNAALATLAVWLLGRLP